MLLAHVIYQTAGLLATRVADEFLELSQPEDAPPSPVGPGLLVLCDHGGYWLVGLTVAYELTLTRKETMLSLDADCPRKPVPVPDGPGVRVLGSPGEYCARHKAPLAELSRACGSRNLLLLATLREAGVTPVLARKAARRYREQLNLLLCS